MKQKLLILASILFASLLAYAALEPSAITITVGFTGTPSPSDIRTSKWIIKQENAWRAAQVTNAVVLPSGTPAEIKSSVLVCLARIATNYMIDSAVQADQEAMTTLTDEQTRDIRRAITDRINGGLTPAQVLTLIKP